MPTKIMVPGVESATQPDEVDEKARQEFGVAFETEWAVRTGAAVRGADAEVEFEVADDQQKLVAELEFDDGVRQWIAFENLRARVQPAERGSAASDVIRIPTTGYGPDTRGVGDLALKGFKLLDVVLPEELLDPVTERAACAIARYYEDRLKPAPGLYAIDKQGKTKEQPGSDTIPGSDQPFLVLLHGAFCTIGSSFGRLISSPEWLELCNAYPQRVFGWNHRTLSESPAKNALDLVTRLPDRARLHLLSHSRGGLIGELLALGPLPPERLDSLARAKGYEEQVAALRDLSALLAAKQLRVERFVRVACPVRGTVLASERLDRYLSVLLNLIGLIPAVDETLIYPFAKAAILSLIRQRTRPEELPGLEAMMPTSPFIRLLNRHKPANGVDLAVVAGDVEGSGLLGRLGVLAADLFFWQDNDLVVNTDAMFKGPEQESGIYYSYEKGPKISHFNYFKNDNSRLRITAWLTRQPDEDPKQTGFRPLEEEPVPEITRDQPPKRAADAPLVVLVPTLMGTHLRIGDQRIWLDMDQLSQGQFSKLWLDGSKKQVVVDEMMSWGYANLTAFLDTRFEVVPFPYDWRTSLAAAGEQLASDLGARLRQHNRPIHLLAHGTGGLVASAMIHNNPDVWKHLIERGGRLVLLGTPSEGASAAIQLLAGSARVVQMLALLVDPDTPAKTGQKANEQAARASGANQVARVFRSFPGVLELLPFDSGDNVGDIAWWRERATIEPDEETGLARRLKEARRVYAQIKPGKTLSAWPEATRQVCYVASTAAAPVAGGAMAGDPSLNFAASALAGPDRIATWTVKASPGAMTQRKAIFNALADLLERGRTDQLGNEPPSRHLGIAEPAAATPVLFPTTTDLAAAAFGRRPRRRRDKDTSVLRVSVAHGSLEHAPYPVAVGHYDGDAIVGAEGFLDRKLDGRLSRRHAMKLYPGKQDTAEILLAPGKHPPGALVIGLGEVGGLSPEVLSRGVMLAALRYATALLESRGQPNDERNYISAAFCTVLIGSSGGHALSVESSVAAILKGAVSANRVLRDQDLWNHVRIDEVQFVELYDDIAAHIAHVVSDLRSEPLAIGLVEGEVVEPRSRMRTLEGGQLRSPATAYDSDWWRRVQISGTGKRRGGKMVDELEFVLLTDRARAEQTPLAMQRPLVDGQVAEAIRRPDFRPDLHASLFEMLLPNTIKDQVKETANLMLVLDANAANYPWEMLCELGQEPLAVRFGLLRQLKTPQYRPNVRSARDKRALVIGEPNTEDPDIPRLKGAREEAEMVAEQLEKFGYEVVAKIDATTPEIVSALYGHEYRIVHICAHGSYNASRPDHSGVVLAKDRFLSAIEFGQLRAVPELVFLNCCHLGSIDTTPWNLLAASVARQQISIGVRAVVAAGWRVNDRAARDFGVQFYQHMLAEHGQFGEAVLRARRAIRNDYPDNNTWGAFQCYGLPTFSLVDRVHRSTARNVQPVTSNELIEQIRRVRVDAETATPARQQELVCELHRYTNLLRNEWRTGRALYDLGEAFAALDELQTAIDLYKDALCAKETKCETPIRAKEQLGHVKVRRGSATVARGAAGGGRRRPGGNVTRGAR